MQTIRASFVYRLILAVVMYIPGSDTASRLLRKTLVRQCNLMAVLVLRTLSDSVRERMNTTDDIVNAGTFLVK